MAPDHMPSHSDIRNTISIIHMFPGVCQVSVGSARPRNLGFRFRDRYLAKKAFSSMRPNNAANLIASGRIETEREKIDRSRKWPE